MDLVVDICLKGIYICVRHVVPILKANREWKNRQHRVYRRPSRILLLARDEWRSCESGH